MANRIVPSDYRTHVARELVESIQETPNTAYYVFLGNHIPYSNGVITQLSDDASDNMVSAFRNMIAGKRLAPADAIMMIRNIPWVANTAYAMYDNGNQLINQSDYYAIVNAGAFSHCWKVLDNNLGNTSTVAPDIAQIDPLDSSYRTGDGYLWKYMYSVDSTTVDKFADDLYFPISANTNVAAVAVAGAIDVIKVDEQGAGYDNWLTGTFSAGDLRAGGDNLIYAVTGNSVSSSVNGFYTGCVLYISGGTGVGQYRTVTDYFANANGNFVVIDSAFTTAPQNASTYQMYPGVTICGSGRQTVNAAARALVNAVGNTIYRVDVLSRGAGYDYAKAAVVANNVVGVGLTANVRAIYAPYGGHGYDQYGELGATRVGFSVKFANTEANTIPATNIYQQVGILKDPLFANVVLNFQSLTTKTFLFGEKVLNFTKRFLQANVATIANSANVSCAGAVFATQIESGDWVYMHSATQDFITQVNVVTNSTFFTVTSRPQFSASDISLYLANVETGGSGYVSQILTGNTVAISNCTGFFSTDDQVIGVQSGATGLIDHTTRNGIDKNFDTYVGMTCFLAVPSSGTFEQNEQVYQGANLMASTANASLHSATLNTGVLTIYTTNNIGLFTGSTIKGANSGAVATITERYSPEIAFGSSKVLYLENVTAVPRSANTSETINVTLEF